MLRLLFLGDVNHVVTKTDFPKRTTQSMKFLPYVPEFINDWSKINFLDEVCPDNTSLPDIGNIWDVPYDGRMNFGFCREGIDNHNKEFSLWEDDLQHRIVQIPLYIQQLTDVDGSLEIEDYSLVSNRVQSPEWMSVSEYTIRKTPLTAENAAVVLCFAREDSVKDTIERILIPFVDKINSVFPGSLLKSGNEQPINITSSEHGNVSIAAWRRRM
jgi:hypothetical protein